MGGRAEVANAAGIIGLHHAAETPALRAAMNLDPNPAKGGGDITLVGGTALQSEAGPSGTLADIESALPASDQISIYIVREDDTVGQIAQMFGVSVNTIVWANDLRRGNVIQPGETLVILPVSGVRHAVKKGETLAGIVKKYNGDMSEVLEFNDLAVGAALTAGDIVVVPYGVEPAPPSIGTTRVIAGVSGPAIVGYYQRPLSSYVRTQGVHGYNGVDLAAPVGTTVLASAAGEVILSRISGWNSGYGNYVVIQHPNGTQTLYAHLSQNYVSAGTTVVQGQSIGAVGTTGKSTGPHLHFEVRGAKNPF